MLFRERQQVVIFALAVAMVSGFLVFRYLPLRKKIKEAGQKQQVQKAAVATTLLQTRRLPALEEQLKELKSSAGNYDARVPQHRDLGEFLQKIADLMNGHNLKEQLIEPGEQITAKQVSCIPVTIQCKGRLKQIFGFFESLQELDRLVRLEKIKLVNDKNFTGTVSMQTKAFIFYGKQASQE